MRIKEKKARIIVMIIGLPVLFALGLRFIFDINLLQDSYQLMSLSFFIGLPYAVGALTIWLSSIDNIRSLLYRICFPWLPIFAFMLVTLAFGLEGWACWLMILPVFMLFASLGGLTAGYFKLKKSEEANKLNLSLTLVLPLLLSPLEHSLALLPNTYRADTSIIIEAPAAAIWEHVVRVKEIRQENDNSTLTKWLGFPRPLRAELNYAGVGGSRKAIFDGGLVFHEVVTAYEPERKIQFSIDADPHDIPSTTLDAHVVVGGQYFDVLDGTYELEPLGQNRYQLHLYSHFTLHTTFNFYARYWADGIMQDIQRNILLVIKERSEQR